MKFGLFCIAPWHESLTADQVLLDTMEQIEAADQLGLDEVWLGEHRFSRHGLLSGFFRLPAMWWPVQSAYALARP